MEVNETFLVETTPQVPAGEHERNRQFPLSAPVEHQSLTSGKNLARNAGQPSDVAPLERVHPGVVQAKVEVNPPPPNVL
jgi:hypothetical protein